MDLLYTVVLLRKQYANEKFFILATDAGSSFLVRTF